MKTVEAVRKVARHSTNARRTFARIRKRRNLRGTESGQTTILKLKQQRKNAIRSERFVFATTNPTPMSFGHKYAYKHQYAQ